MVSEFRAVEEQIIEEIDRACLEQVLSISEVSALYHKDNKTVYNLCKEGRLVCRRAAFGSVWFISKRSCDERWNADGKLNRQSKG
jgi:Helix-turn-helix domain